MGARTPTTLRADSFKGAEGLQAPLNDLLTEIQERLSTLELRQEFAVLGPRRVVLPVDAAADPSSIITFAVPEGWTPGVAFVLALETADAVNATPINPVGAEFRVESSQVAVTRLTTASSTAFAYNLTLGVTRG